MPLPSTERSGPGTPAQRSFLREYALAASLVLPTGSEVFGQEDPLPPHNQVTRNSQHDSFDRLSLPRRAILPRAELLAAGESRLKQLLDGDSFAFILSVSELSPRNIAGIVTALNEAASAPLREQLLQRCREVRRDPNADPRAYSLVESFLAQMLKGENKVLPEPKLAAKILSTILDSIDSPSEETGATLFAAYNSSIFEHLSQTDCSKLLSLFREAPEVYALGSFRWIRFPAEDGRTRFSVIANGIESLISDTFRAYPAIRDTNAEKFAIAAERIGFRVLRELQAREDFESEVDLNEAAKILARLPVPKSKDSLHALSDLHASLITEADVYLRKTHYLPPIAPFLRAFGALRGDQVNGDSSVLTVLTDTLCLRGAAAGNHTLLVEWWIDQASPIVFAQGSDRMMVQHELDRVASILAPVARNMGVQSLAPNGHSHLLHKAARELAFRLAQETPRHSTLLYAECMGDLRRLAEALRTPSRHTRAAIKAVAEDLVEIFLN